MTQLEPIEIEPEPEPEMITELQSEPEPEPEPAPEENTRRNYMPAFWTVASVISLAVNLVLLVALIILGRELFVLKGVVGNNLLGGLYENFIFMDQAHIKTEIAVTDTIPIDFELPINKDTVVILTEDTTINGATVNLNTGGVRISSLANIILPAGTRLPVHLEFSLPVSTRVPVNLKVPVDIPLENTDLHKPFIGLQQVVAPFYQIMQPQIKTPQDLSICKPFSLFCTMYFQQPQPANP